MSVGPSNFYYAVSGKVAEQLLRTHGKDGSFLARPSTQQGDFTLSVRRGDRVTHIRITNNGDGLYLSGGETFANLSELVQYYMENQDQLKEVNGETIPLKYPMSLTLQPDALAQFENSTNDSERNRRLSSSKDEDVTKQRYFHASINGKEAEKILMEQGQPGSFLVRESQMNPGLYALSVRITQNKVTHVLINRGENGYDVLGGEDAFDTVKGFVDHYMTTPMIADDGEVIQLKNALASTRIPAMRITERLTNNDLVPAIICTPGSEVKKSRLGEEFEDLERIDAKHHLYSRKEGRRDENQTRNRYKNIVPFDHTRVILDGSPEHDYINASRIEVLPEYKEFAQLSRSYISTQGPLANTIGDFWRMIWEFNCHLIVMVTREVERGMPKCARYWPDLGTQVDYDNCLRAETIKEHTHSDYVLREIRLQPIKSSKDDSRIVYQYQYIGWPDHGCPPDPTTVLNFIDQWNNCLQSKCPPDSGPVLVHCSAGIGRTGTVIAIDLIINQLRRVGLHVTVDIARTVQMLREQRSGMVQTEQQYAFIYLAIKHYVEMARQRLDKLGHSAPGHEYLNITLQEPGTTNQLDMQSQANRLADV